MMSKERELLMRWLRGEANEMTTHIPLLIETQNLLAQPEQKPEPEQKPLTPQQISEGNQSMLNVTREAFKQGVKYAEKMHGIGGVE